MKIWLPTIRAGSGADVFTKRLAAGLERAGCEPVVTWIDHRYEFLPSLSREAPPQGTDVVHANSWSAYAFARHGIPTVATDHGFVDDESFIRIKKPAQRIYHDLVISRHVRRSLRTCAAVTTVSHYLAKVVQPHSPRPVVAIPNWIDTESFKPLPRGADREGAFRLLYAGGDSVRKGSDVVRCLARQHMPGVELWCRESLHGMLGETRVPVRFFTATPPESMPALYAQCDAVLMPSRYEGFGYVAAEALACERPVLGFATGALREVCGDEAAVLVATNDVDGLKRAILKLATQRGLCREMGKRGRTRVLHEFTEVKSIRAYINIYQRLASARP